MYELSIEEVFADSLYKEVKANDVLNVFNIINKCNSADDEIIDLENKLLINSFGKNKFLFNSKFLYYRFASLVKTIGMFSNNANEVYEAFQNLNDITEKLFNCKGINIEEKVKLFNLVCLKYELLCNQSNFNDNNQFNLNKSMNGILSKVSDLINEHDSQKKLIYTTLCERKPS